MRLDFHRGGSCLRFLPGGLPQGLFDQAADLLLERAVVLNASPALLGLGSADGFGGGFAGDEAGPTVIGSMQLGRVWAVEMQPDNNGKSASIVIFCVFILML